VNAKSASDTKVVDVPPSLGSFFVEKSRTLGAKDEVRKLYGEHKTISMRLLDINWGFCLCCRQSDGAYPSRYFHYLGVLALLFVDGYVPTQSKFFFQKKEAGKLADVMNHVSKYIYKSGEYSPPIANELYKELECLKKELYSG
jgi:hypothetical protein